ncbi:MAG: hypothetical protein EOP04_22840 [Proteobacteria bacterium]|nr:MAG: hypothetical protein EOP04_22840 [Pseudomonadota bacterium]
MYQKNDLALYYLHVRAIDETTEKNIEIELEWGEEVFPYIKGSGPTIMERHDDGSLSLAIVGRSLDKGLGVRVVANGYRSRVLNVSPIDSGISGPFADRTQELVLSKK